MLSLSLDPVETVIKKNKKKYLNFTEIYKFVTFNKYSGKILNVTGNKIFVTKDYLVTKKFVVKNLKDLISGNLKIYSVELDIRTNKYYIKKKAKTLNTYVNQDTSYSPIYFNYIKHYKNKTNKFDLRFTQFLDKNFLKIEVDKFIFGNYLNSLDKFTKIVLYFANRLDLDILYDKKEINLKDLIKNDSYEIDISEIRAKIDPRNLCIFTKKIFSNYDAIIIDSYYEVNKQVLRTFNVQNVLKFADKKLVDIIIYKKNFDTLEIQITKNFKSVNLIDKTLKFYVVDPTLDFLITTLNINSDILIKNKKLRIQTNTNLDNNKIIHNNNNLRVLYENTYN